MHGVPSAADSMLTKITKNYFRSHFTSIMSHSFNVIPINLFTNDVPATSELGLN